MKEGTFIDSDNILDLVFTTEADRIGIAEIHPPLPRCHHCPVVFEYVLQKNVLVDAGQNGSRCLWGWADHNTISGKLWSVDWNWEFEGRSTGDCFVLFSTYIESLIEKHVSVGTRDFTRRWMRAPPRRLRHRKKQAWREYKQLRNNFGRPSNRFGLLLLLFLSLIMNTTVL